MLSDTLANIRTTLNEHRFLTSAEISSVCDLLHMYRIGMWLYPGVIARRVPLSIENTYALTDLLTQMGYIKSYYELYCNNCQKATGMVFETLTEMPEIFECELCHSSMCSIQNSIIKTQNPAISGLERSRCRSSQEITDSPTPFSALNYEEHPRPFGAGSPEGNPSFSDAPYRPPEYSRWQEQPGYWGNPGSSRSTAHTHRFWPAPQ